MTTERQQLHRRDEASLLLCESAAQTEKYNGTYFIHMNLLLEIESQCAIKSLNNLQPK